MYQIKNDLQVERKTDNTILLSTKDNSNSFVPIWEYANADLSKTYSVFKL